MKILISGISILGIDLCGRLINEGHQVVLIEKEQPHIKHNLVTKDIPIITGNCASIGVLQAAGIMEADVLIAATPADERNLLCCITAHDLKPEIHTIARIRTPEYLETVGIYYDNFGLSMTIDPELYAAKEVESLLSYPGFLQRESYSKGMTDVIAVDLPQKHKLCDHPLKDLPKITGVRALVCAVVRNGIAVTPGADFVLLAGDRLYITASEEDLTKLLDSFNKDRATLRNIMIIGGGDTTCEVLRRLRSDRFNLTVVEQDRRICEQLASDFSKVTVIHGDARQLSFLDAQGVGKQDALLCLSGNDEANTIAGVYGNTLGIPEIIVKLRSGDYRKLFSGNHYGTIIDPQKLCGDSILRFVRSVAGEQNAPVSLRSITGKTMIAEFIIGPGAKHCGEKLENIRFKSNVILASINRYGRNILPGADSMFLSGDRVLAVFSRDDINVFNDLFR